MLSRLSACALALLITIPVARAARGINNLSDADAIANTSYAPLERKRRGPFTIAFWFQSGNVNAGPAGIAEGHGSGGAQWAVIYGYTSQQIEFFDGNGAVRLNTGITIGDTNWHHVAYRKSTSHSSWDKFLDGVKTNISPSITFLAGVKHFLYLQCRPGAVFVVWVVRPLQLGAVGLGDSKLGSRRSPPVAH